MCPEPYSYSIAHMALVVTKVAIPVHLFSQSKINKLTMFDPQDEFFDLMFVVDDAAFLCLFQVSSVFDAGEGKIFTGTDDSNAGGIL